MRDSILQIEAASNAVYGMVDGCVQAVLKLVDVTGRRVACRRGCNACCDCVVPVTLAEAVPIARWLSSPERTQRLDRFRQEVQHRRNSLGGEAQLLEEAIQRADASPIDGPDFKAFKSAARAYRHRRLVCPFSAGESGCEVYPIRPLLCRVHWVADTADYCGPESRLEPYVIQHAALSQVIDLACSILNGASAEAGRPGRTLLHEAVAHALEWA